MIGEGEHSEGFLGGEPEHAASSFVHDGALAAANYLQDVLTPEEYKIVRQVADGIFEVLDRPLNNPTDAALDHLPDVLENPWVRFALEVRFMERSAEAAHTVLTRYDQVQPFLSGLDLKPKALRYLTEARRTFLIGMDAACVAFCGAALEQVIKEALRPLPASAQTLESLINKANERGQLTASVDAAHMLRRQRNHVMHAGLWEERIESNVAAQAIRNLAKVLQELGSTSDRG